MVSLNGLGVCVVLVLPSCPTAAVLPPLSTPRGFQPVPHIGLQEHYSCSPVANPLTICVLMLDLKWVQHHW